MTVIKVPKVVVWGTYDLGKPRVRMILDSLDRESEIVSNISSHIWSGVEDKTQINGMKIIFVILRTLFAYPFLIVRYIFSPKHDMVFVPYMGLFDVIVLWPLARLRGVSICLDVFISLYDTVVCDRKLIKSTSILAKFLYSFERLVYRLSKTLIIDTKAHARYLESLFDLEPRSVRVIWVCAENDFFSPLSLKFSHKKQEKEYILFYGQFIPLHGIDIIVSAAEILSEEFPDLDFMLVGKGQEQKEIDRVIKYKDLGNIRRLDWVGYCELNRLLAKASICLGIFSSEGKALRVIPNKVYQIISAGKPLVTADTPAIREVFQPCSMIELVEPGSPESLAKGIKEMLHRIDNGCIDSGELPIIRREQQDEQLSSVLSAHLDYESSSK